MNYSKEIIDLLDRCFALDGRIGNFDSNSPLLGALPELDSMGVVTLIAALEDRYGFAIDDDEINGDTFASVGTLAAFVAEKVGN
jgi:acyl carrier protein